MVFLGSNLPICPIVKKFKSERRAQRGTSHSAKSTPGVKMQGIERLEVYNYVAEPGISCSAYSKKHTLKVKMIDIELLEVRNTNL